MKKFGLTTYILIFETYTILDQHVLRIPLFLLYHHWAAGYLRHSLCAQRKPEQMALAHNISAGNRKPYLHFYRNVYRQ